MDFFRAFLSKRAVMVWCIALNFGLIKAQCNLLCNDDFENNQVVGPGNFTIVDASLISCWNTTATDNNVEVWGTGFNGVPAYSGSQFIELNAYLVCTIYQDFITTPGTSLSISFAHRGRMGVDVLSLDIGPVGGPYTTIGSYSDGNTSWGYYTETYIVPGGVGNNFSLRFNSVSAAGGNPAVGNFLDAVTVKLPYITTLTVASANASCGNANGTATANPVNGAAPYSYSWSTSPAQTTQSIAGLSAGTYIVTVSDLNGCVNIDSVTITASSSPNVEVSAGGNPLCDSTKLNWASWGTVNGTSGSGTISSDLSVVVTKPSGGLSTTGGMYNGGIFPTQYNVPAGSTAIRNDLGGLFTFCFNRPVVNPQIAMSSIGNPGNSVQVNTSVPYQVIWTGIGMSYPSSTTFIGTEGFTIVQFPGVHTCISFDYLQSETYCNLAFGTLDTNCQSLVSPPQCAGGADTLTASGAVTYSWFPPTGLNTSTGAVVIASPLVTTTYYVTGFDANNCSDTDSITVTVIPLPTVTLTGDTIICAGDSTTLTASGGGTYLWTPGNSTDSIITVSPASNTLYTVVVTSSSGCIDSSSINVFVNPLPQALFNLITVCKNDLLTFSDASIGSISNWNWDHGDGTSSTLPNSTYTYSTCDTFSVKLVVTTNGGCKDSITKTAKVNCLPIADFSVADVCLNQVMNFTDLSAVSGDTVSGWSWDFGGGGALGITQNASTTYSSAGLYNVSLTATSNKGCKDTATNTVIVHSLPVAAFSTTNVCDGTIVPYVDQSTISGTDLIVFWAWDFGDGSPVYNNQNASHPYAVKGSYIAELVVVSDFGCSDSISKTILVHPNPVADFFATDTSGCAPLCISFLDQSSVSPGTNMQWEWTVADGSMVSYSQNFDHCFTNSSGSAAYYSIILTVTSDSGCVASITKDNYISVFPNPVADFSVQPTRTSFLNPVIEVTDVSAGVDVWNWDFGDQAISALPNPGSHTYADTGAYAITLITANQYGCSDTMYKTVVIEPDFVFYIPNAFSPNNDIYNKTFNGKGLYIKEYEMSIFDRWGNLIYKTVDINLPWDGRFKNSTELAEADVYVYSIKIIDIRKDEYFYKGIVTLIR